MIVKCPQHGLPDASFPNRRERSEVSAQVYPLPTGRTRQLSFNGNSSKSYTQSLSWSHVKVNNDFNNLYKLVQSSTKCQSPKAGYSFRCPHHHVLPRLSASCEVVGISPSKSLCQSTVKNSKIGGIAPFALHLPSCGCNCNILQPSFSACGVFQFDNYTMEAGWSRNYYASGWTQWGNWEGEPPWLNATKPPQKWQIMHVSSCINFWLLCIFCS